MAYGQRGRVTVTNPLEDRGIAMYTVADPDFTTQVRSFIDSSEMLNKLQPYMDRSVIVVNNTGQYLWGMSIVYEYTGEYTASGKPWRWFVTPEAIGPERRWMMAPAASFLILPQANFFWHKRSDGTIATAPAVEIVTDANLWANLKEGMDYWWQKPVVISVDSIIYEDRTVVGPDVLERMQKLNEAVERDKKLEEQLKSMHGSELRALLEATVEEDLHRATQTHAQAMLIVLDNQGEDALKRQLLDEPDWKLTTAPFTRGK